MSKSTLLVHGSWRWDRVWTAPAATLCIHTKDFGQISGRTDIQGKTVAIVEQLHVGCYNRNRACCHVIGLFRFVTSFVTFPQEIIQNADDAGASTVHFYLDNRHHGTDTLVEPKLAEFQGPALLAYNDAVFTAEDWQSIQSLQQSVKTRDPFKVGKFGIGFNSVYHITGIQIQCIP